MSYDQLSLPKSPLLNQAAPLVFDGLMHSGPCPSPLSFTTPFYPPLPPSLSRSLPPLSHQHTFSVPSPFCISLSYMPTFSPSFVPFLPPTL